MTDSGSHVRGLLDTCALIDLELLPLHALPDELSIASITLAELSAGPQSTTDPTERARRQARLQHVEAAFDPIPFGTLEARAYAMVHAATVQAGRSSRSRFADLLIAATALANNLPLVTRNPQDFAPLGDLIDIITV